ncbi:hypothetical protein JNB91_21930 [Rhizobium wenxiniae]|uniref:hypothetical protein n=1 Tax=Rhizobium wenxiniae TaxID=1737357 RepID=UPI001C6E2D26|nr:hypothetical protein [Rhizobium wenxiniae]MBW9090478.1 hypothetical protein [Rhizobium wenxiniae]
MAEQVLSDAKKEQIKLRATFLNNIGIGVMLIGVFTPIIRVVYGDINPQIGTLWLAAAPTGCFLLGTALHLSGGWILRGLSK